MYARSRSWTPKTVTVVVSVELARVAVPVPGASRVSHHAVRMLDRAGLPTEIARKDAGIAPADSGGGRWSVSSSYPAEEAASLTAAPSQTLTAGLDTGGPYRNSDGPNEPRGPFGYANESIIVGPDVVAYWGGPGFAGNNPCYRKMCRLPGGIEIRGGASLPFGAGAGVSNTWIKDLW